MIIEESRPIVKGTIDDIVERDRLASAQFYFKPRNIEATAEGPREGTAMKAGFNDTRGIPCNLCVFRLDTDVLQVGKFGAVHSGLILKRRQFCVRKIGTERFEDMITEMPGFASAVPR